MRAGEGTESCREGIARNDVIRSGQDNRVRWVSFVSAIVARRKRAPHIGLEFMWKTGVAEEDCGGGCDRKRGGELTRREQSAVG